MITNIDQFVIEHEADEETSPIDDIQHLSMDEIRDFYGIRFNDDGTIYDPVRNKSHDSLMAWAKYEDEYWDQ